MIVNISTQGVKAGGTLSINAKEGKLFKDTEFFGKMDPYCKFEANGRTYQTPVHQEGGKTPRWNYFFDVSVKSMEEELRFSLYDKEKYNDDFIGEGYVKYKDLCINNGVSSWFNIFSNGNISGMVYLETKYKIVQ